MHGEEDPSSSSSSPPSCCPPPSFPHLPSLTPRSISLCDYLSLSHPPINPFLSLSSSRPSAPPPLYAPCVKLLSPPVSEAQGGTERRSEPRRSRRSRFFRRDMCRTAPLPVQCGVPLCDGVRKLCVLAVSRSLTGI